jgi:UDP-N-acetylmuramate--alanine ligase
VTRSATPGAGLAAAREPRRIATHERIHVVGAAGAGASAAALHASWVDAIADGCDRGGPSPYSRALEAAGIRLAWEHDPRHVTRTPPPDRLAVTKALTAIDPNHPELAAARSAGIPIEPWQQVIADAAYGRTLIGVAGTHGKSTSAGWLVHVLASGGADPSAFVGALLPPDLTGGLTATARRGGGAAFVVEADEYAGNFDVYHPALAIVTSAEWDHPDVFADRSAVVGAFDRWIRAMSMPAVAVINVTDAGAAELASGLGDWPGRIVATALVDADPQRSTTMAQGMAEEYATGAGNARAILGRIVRLEPDATIMELHGLDALHGSLPVRLRTAGRHNAANALGVAAAAAQSGLGAPVVIDGLASFAGIGRRLERKGDGGGVVVYDDYGHHPTAIRETLAALRQREPGRRIWAVYEPLTYHRTAALLDAFADVLAAADGVAIADIWAGRDPDTTVASAAGLAEAVAARNPRIRVAAPGTVEQTAAWLAGEVRSGDAVLVMGGGRSYRIADLLVEGLTDR